MIASNVKTAGNLLEGVIHKNIDVEFDAMAGVSAAWSEEEKNFILNAGNGEYSTVLHVTRNNINLQTGSNKGEEVVLDIGDMSSAALGVSGVNVMTHERASSAISTLDRAIRKVSAQRTKIGSYQNAFESATESLT